MKLFAVTANPVLHSLSPELHNHAFKSAGIDAVYTRLAADSGEEALALMKAIGIAGMNISAPFKEKLASLVDFADDRSRALGAVNTIVMKDGSTHGYNTDVDGVLGMLHAECEADTNPDILILGTGGAARAAAAAVELYGRRPIIAGRSSSGLSYFTARSVRAVSLEETAPIVDRVSVIISTVPSSSEILGTLELKNSHIILDAIYGKETVLARRSREAGARYRDGKSWLVHQAAAAFKLFAGVEISPRVLAAGLEQPARPIRPLYFIGLMGAGKTSVGRRTSAALDMSFRDIDEAVESTTGLSVARIFSDRGESEFRALELGEVMRASEADIGCISCGGGLPVTRAGGEHIAGTGLGIWLWAKPSELAERLGPDASTRPLLARGDRSDTLAALLAERTEPYARAASVIVSTSGKTVEQIAEKISHEYRTAFGN